MDKKMDEFVKKICRNYDEKSEERLLGLTYFGGKYISVHSQPRWWSGYPDEPLSGGGLIYDVETEKAVAGGSGGVLEFTIGHSSDSSDATDIDITPYISDADRQFINEYKEEKELVDTLLKNHGEMREDWFVLTMTLAEEKGMTTKELQAYCNREYRYKHFYPKYMD